MVQSDDHHLNGAEVKAKDGGASSAGYAEQEKGRWTRSLRLIARLLLFAGAAGWSVQLLFVCLWDFGVIGAPPLMAGSRGELILDWVAVPPLALLIYLAVTRWRWWASAIWRARSWIGLAAFVLGLVFWVGYSWVAYLIDAALEVGWVVSIVSALHKAAPLGILAGVARVLRTRPITG